MPLFRGFQQRTMIQRSPNSTASFALALLRFPYLKGSVDISGISRCALLLLMIVVSVAAPRIGRGAALIIDQSSSGGPGGGAFPLDQFAQSFKPTLSSLGFVELGLDLGVSGPASLRVDLRDGGIAGPVIGSAFALLENSFSLPVSVIDLTRFEFSPPVALVPGNTYVIDLVHVSGGAGIWELINPGVYPDGEASVNGAPKTWDFAFRTGLVVPSQLLTQPPLPVEYSDMSDDRAIPGGGDHDVPDPGQVLYTEFPDGPADKWPKDASDFLPALETGTDPLSQVDALASAADALVDDVLSNHADLLVSLVGDGGPAEAAVFFESPAGMTGTAFRHVELNALDNAPGEIDDLDGLELWGPVGSADAIYFSHFDDLASGTSVFRFSGGAAVPWISHAEILAAVTALGFSGSSQQVDLDALLVENGGDEQNFDIGDGILFSIRAGGNFDGGEIIHLRVGVPPAFLVHGGHKWDTTFDVVAAMPESKNEDVDALEARPAAVAAQIPTLGLLGLAVFVLGLFIALRGSARKCPAVLT